MQQNECECSMSEYHRAKIVQCSSDLFPSQSYDFISFSVLWAEIDNKLVSL